MARNVTGAHSRFPKGIRERVQFYNGPRPTLSFLETQRRLNDWMGNYRASWMAASSRNKDPATTAGFFAALLYITDKARQSSQPFAVGDFLAPSGGQIAGLRGGTCDAILAAWNLPFRFGTESGGTNRGSIALVEPYLQFLNSLSRYASINFFALTVLLLKQIRAYFENQPVELTFNPRLTLRAFLRAALSKVREAERRRAGANLVGSFMQHMIGAKLELRFGVGSVQHHPAHQADSQYGRSGDFLMGAIVVHVTTAPTEALIAKCAENLRQRLRPIIVTSYAKTSTAETLAQNAGLEDQIEVLDFEGFIVSNLVEKALEVGSYDRKVTVDELLRVYTSILAKHDPVNGVKISLSN